MAAGDLPNQHDQALRRRAEAEPVVDADVGHGRQRQRVSGQAGTTEQAYQRHRPPEVGGYDVNAFSAEDRVPVMEYTGPDFGFDASRLGEGLFIDPLDPDMGGLFSNIGWDTYL